MKINDLLKRKLFVTAIFVLLTLSYLHWLIVISHFGFVPFHRHIFHFLTLPLTSLLSLFLYLFKIQEIDIYFTPVLYYALFSFFIVYLIKKVKWHAIIYLISIFLASWVLLEIVACLQKEYYYDNHFEFNRIVIYSYGHRITELSSLVYL
jgi:hypothetical protein